MLVIAVTAGLAGLSIYLAGRHLAHGHEPEGQA
jgi:hypothetical protein